VFLKNYNHQVLQNYAKIGKWAYVLFTWQKLAKPHLQRYSIKKTLCERSALNSRFRRGYVAVKAR
jgi:hypothetical protein